MNETEARRLIDEKLPPAEGDRMTALRATDFGVYVTEFLMDMEKRTGRSMSSKEVNAMTTEDSVVRWLTAATAP